MKLRIFKDFDLTDFWDDSEYSLKEYVEEIPTDELIKSVEQELGYKLPVSYIELMKLHNGGIPVNTNIPTEEPTSWANDHVAITGIMGIGRNKRYSLCGKLGSRFMIEEWGYPDDGVYICDCPSAGHDMILLDYSKCGKNGEPQVVHVDQESDYEKTFLAKDFESFIRALVNDDVYDSSEEDLQNNLKTIKNGCSSDILQEFFNKEAALNYDKILRNILTELTTKKGYFALHADELSHLVYDIQFYLYSKNREIKTKEEYLKDYPKMIAFGNREISTGGYAPDFIVDWLKERLKKKSIETGLLSGLKFTAGFEKIVIDNLKKYE